MGPLVGSAHFCGVVAGAGVALQLVGAVLALAGVVLAFKRMERVPESVQRMSAAARALRNATRRASLPVRRLSRKLTGWPRAKTASGQAHVTTSGTMSARGYAERRHKRLDRQMDKLRKDLRALERRLDATRDELAGEIAAEREARESGDAEARQFAGDLLARVLDVEIYAAAAILVGVAAANVAPRLC